VFGTESFLVTHSGGKREQLFFCHRLCPHQSHRACYGRKDRTSFLLLLISFHRKYPFSKRISLSTNTIHSSMKAISLFAGAGGDTLGMTNAGVSVVAFCENNRDAVRTSPNDVSRE
jgi:hypothetical protein